MPKPVTILIGALGGDGGGVLCDWIVTAAQSQGLGVQATQIPGVAQRTGATTYYLEVVPRTAPDASVLALNPAIGEVDVALATELLEAGRMIFNGFVTPDRTTLIASTHRVLAIGERMAMGDGSFDVGRLLRAVKERSKEQILFDMDQAAEESGGVINAVLLGTLAGSGKLPIADSAFEAAIRHAGKSIDSNLAAFAFGRGHARGELEQAVREHRKRQAAAQGIEDLIERARRTYPASSLDIVEEGIRRLTSYQDRRYAMLYLDRLDSIHALGSADLLRETARHLAVRMSFEDVIRVAQAKTSAERVSRVRSEVRAKDQEPLTITEHFKPGIEEIAAVLPPGFARHLLAWGERTGRLGKTYFSMHVHTTTILGFARDGSPMCVPSASAIGAAPAHRKIVPLGKRLVAAVLIAIPSGAVRPSTSFSLTIDSVPSAFTAARLSLPEVVKVSDRVGASTTAGCYTEYEVRPTCNAVWVPAHRGAWGRWHRGHWRCV